MEAKISKNNTNINGLGVRRENCLKGETGIGVVVGVFKKGGTQ